MGPKIEWESSIHLWNGRHSVCNYLPNTSSTNGGAEQWRPAAFEFRIVDKKKKKKKSKRTKLVEWTCLDTRVLIVCDYRANKKKILYYIRMPSNLV